MKNIRVVIRYGDNANMSESSARFTVPASQNFITESDISMIEKRLLEAVKHINNDLLNKETDTYKQNKKLFSDGVKKIKVKEPVKVDEESLNKFLERQRLVQK
jgi:hypothetical protein